MKESFKAYYLKHENPDASDEEIEREWQVVVRDLAEHEAELHDIYPDPVTQRVSA